MKFNFFICLLSFVLSFNCKCENLKENTDKDLQALINDSYKNNKTLNLKKNANYHIYKALDVKCSINGNNAKIIPHVKQTIAVDFSEDSIYVKNLEITGKNHKMINVSGNNIYFSHCNFYTENYFVLLRLSGDNNLFNSCRLENAYQKKEQLVLKNKDKVTINNLTVMNCRLLGGIHFGNKLSEKKGNYVFKDNYIKIDYSHTNQNIKSQDDGFYFGGINGVRIEGNIIQFKNVNRGFKMTDSNPTFKGKVISKNPTDKVIIKNNIINSKSINGKQLFDFFDGTATISIMNNKIRSIGHTTIFEDKTTLPLNTTRNLFIKGNEIFFDFRILYYRGAEQANSLQQDVKLNVSNNEFYFTPEKKIKTLRRVGSEKDFKLEYPIYARSITEFKFINNKLHFPNSQKPFQSTFTFFINDVKSAILENNTLDGGVLFEPYENGKFTFKNNNVEAISLKELVKIRLPKAKKKIKYFLEIERNDIHVLDENFKLSNSKHLSEKYNLIKEQN